MWEDYLFPTTVEQALAILRDHRGEARIIAGGTDLILDLENGERATNCLVDITRIPGLDGIELQDGYITLGANVTHAQVADSTLIQERATALAEGCQQVGGPQIRNIATVVGNVVSSQPAADATLPLLALDAEAEIADEEGTEWHALGTLFEGPGSSRVDSTAQMVTRLRFLPLSARQGSAYERFARRRALALPILAGAVVVETDATGKVFEGVRISLGPVAPVPFRARRTEKALRGSSTDGASIATKVHTVLKEAKPRTSILRASMEYRRELLPVLLRRGITRALQRARG